MKNKVSQSRKHHIFLYVVILASSCTLLSCAVGAPLAVGTVYLSKERAKIRVTEDGSDTKGCQFIKHVKASTLWGGMAFQDEALEKIISDLTHESVEAGANLLLIRSKYKSFNGSNAQGDAYLCPIIDEIPASSREEEK